MSDASIRAFLAAPAFAVAGASADRAKFGNKVLRCYLQRGLRVVPVHPRETQLEGLACVASVSDLPDEVSSLSIVTPPPVTERIVEAAAVRGIEHVWMQPGAESPKAIASCQAHGIEVIADGSCLLVILGFRER